MAIDAIPRLAVVGALAVNWLNTSHGDSLGHDHHCPNYRWRDGDGNFVSAMEIGDPETCRCGWATFYQAYLDVTNAK